MRARLVMLVGMSFFTGVDSLHMGLHHHFGSVSHEEDVKIIAGVPVYHYNRAQAESELNQKGSSIGFTTSANKSRGLHETNWIVMFNSSIAETQLEELCQLSFTNCRSHGHVENGTGIPFLLTICSTIELNATLHNLRDEGKTGLISEIELDLMQYVSHVEHDFSEYLIDDAVTTATWGLNAIGKSSAPSDGIGVHAFVLDTGVRTTHSQFTGRALPTIESLTTLGGVKKCECGNTSCAADTHGHGTHCAGTIAGIDYGVAPNTIIHAVKVMGDDGYGYTSWTLKALDYIRNYGMKPGVLSMSLGAQGTNNAEKSAIDLLVMDSFVVVVSAGNEEDNACGYSPAWVSSAITVGATDQTNAISWYSNHGNCVDIFAPGSRTLSAGINSDTSATLKSGTSMACPHVSGAVAILQALDHTISPAQVLTQLLASAKQNFISGDLNGAPNLFLQVHNLTVPGVPR